MTVNNYKLQRAVRKGEREQEREREGGNRNL